MRQRKSYQKDAFTTVIESLSTTSDSSSHEDHNTLHDSTAPFPRDEARVTILSEIEKRLTQFPPKIFSMRSTPDNALVLYRSPESMGLPKLERQKQEDLKIAMRKRIAEKRKLKVATSEGDGYDADAEDLDDSPTTSLPLPYLQTNGVKNHHDMVDHHIGDEEMDDGDMMELD
jgi:hypothetical protein